MGAATIEVAGLGPMKCSGVTMTGEVTGPKTLGEISATFSGCSGALGCHNTTTAGEIKTTTLKGEIGYFDEAFGSKHAQDVGLDLEPASGPYLAEELECGLVRERWSGSVIVEIESQAYNTFTKELKLKLEQSSGKQAIQNLEGMPKDTLLTETWNGEWNSGAETGFAGEMVNKGEELELKG